MKGLSGLCLLWILAGGFCLCAAAAPQPIKDEYTVRRWGVEDGLPEGTVTAIEIFSDGFLWLTTPRHIVRFDGAEFVPLPQEAYPENSPKRFNCIMCDRQGRVWVSGDTGVMRRDGGVWQLVPFRGNVDFSQGDLWRVETPDGRLEQSPHLVFFWVKESPDGVIWAASNAGMYRFDGQSLNLILPSATGVAGLFTSATMDDSGGIWLVQSGNLRSFDGEHYESADSPCGKGREALFQVFSGAGDSLWGKRLDGKLYRREDSLWEEVRPSGLRHAAILEQANDKIWFGAVEGIYRSNRTNLLMLAGSGIDRAHDVRCLKASPDGSLWAGSGNGLFQLKPRVVRMFTIGTKSEEQTITALLPNSSGGFWAGIAGRGISAGLPGALHPFKTDPPVLCGATVSALCIRHNNDFWVGTRDDHLWEVLMNGEAHQSRSFEGYASRDITALAETQEGRLWVGTREGLFKQDSQNQLNRAGGPDDSILALIAEADNGIWAGTQGSGLWHINPDGKVIVLRKAEGLPSDTVRALHRDQEGRLWMATPGGLAVLLNTTPLNPEISKSQLVCLTREQGLPSDDIWQMLDDGSGNIWLGMRRSILRIAKKEIMDVAEGRRKVLTFRTFGPGDGLEGELTGGDHSGPLAVRTADNRLWFATHAGIAMIDSVSLEEQSLITPVYIEELSAQQGGHMTVHRLTAHDMPGDSSPAIISPSVTLPAGSHNIAFRFTTPLFVDTEQVLFRTRLDGYEDKWSIPSTARNTLFSRLPPGSYRFSVMASRPMGGWSESGTSVAFSIRPLVWQTAWFLTLSGLLSLVAVGAVVGLLVRRRGTLKLEQERREAKEREREMARKRAVEHERIRIARDIHDDLGAGLTQMALQSELAQSEHSNPEQLQLRLDHIFNAASTLAQGLNEIVWAVNPKNDTLDSMLSYLENYADEYLRSTNLRFRPDLPAASPDLPVSSMVRHHLFCAMREALHNAVKYAGPCEVQLRVRLTGTTLTVELADTGCGFTPDSFVSKAGKHNGLLNMQNRMKEIGGRFDLNTEPGRGTCLKFQVDLNKK